MMPDDLTLLREFASRQSEPAFAALVERYVGLVHSAALRQTGDAHLAEEITQAVFIILARKAAKLGKDTILSAWLYRTTRYVASNALKIQRRRQAREQEAYMQSTLQTDDTDAAWRQLAPLLDDTMDKLSERDRAAVVLRYFENRPWREVADRMRLNEDAAQKRVARALEKLRGLFYKRGVMFTATLIAGAVSANSVQAAPLTLTKPIMAVAISKGSLASASTLTLVKGAMKLMTWLKIKTAVALAAAVVFTAGTTIVVTKVAAKGADNVSAVDDSAWDQMDTRVLDTLPPAFVLRPTHFTDGGSGAATSGSQKMLGRAVSFETLMAMAYGEHGKRIVFPSDLPAGKYDLLVTDPKITAEALQEKIKQQLGYAAHRESRAADVYLLELKQTGAPGLRVSRVGNDGEGGGASGSGSGGSGQFGGQAVRTIRNKMSNTSFPVLVMNLQGYLDRPVIDHTGLTGNYDIDLKVVVKPGDSDTKAFMAALPEQLGLQLVPASENIDMLVVEKAK
jgi:uncharacterized protein (TIGR03435 family)